MWFKLKILNHITGPKRMLFNKEKMIGENLAFIKKRLHYCI
jgi:hypothetical protein